MEAVEAVGFLSSRKKESRRETESGVMRLYWGRASVRTEGTESAQPLGLGGARSRG